VTQIASLKAFIIIRVC